MANYSNIGLSAITKPTQEINDAGEKKNFETPRAKKTLGLVLALT